MGRVGAAGRQVGDMKIYAIMLLVSAIITSAQLAGLPKVSNGKQS
jgi:hypothetical protein